MEDVLARPETSKSEYSFDSVDLVQVDGNVVFFLYQPDLV